MILLDGQGLIIQQRFTVFRLMKNAFIIYESPPPPPWDGLIISPSI